MAFNNYLSDCSGELQNPETNPLRGWTPYSETLRRTGWALAAWAVAATTKGPMVSELFYACTELASAQYEKRDAFGSIAVAARKHPNIELVMEFQDSVPITELRSTRKLLQLSVSGLALLCDGEAIYGTGRVAQGYDVQAKNLFQVKFTGPGIWELWHHEQSLMTVSNGNVRLPSPGFPEKEMRRHLLRIFGTLSDGVQRNLCDLAKAACDQRSGTTFIISTRASDEAERLQHQCFRVNSFDLAPALLPSLTDIDGAVLIDVDGKCHAIGVILDGRAGNDGAIAGNRGRGARYNSAVRYSAGEHCPRCLTIVRSEDGMLDFLLGGVPADETSSAGS